MREILTKIVQRSELHKKWLNTLSFLENAGARKISACEEPELVDITQLKHAAEEHRHAYYLKKQIQKLDGPAPRHYGLSELLAPIHTRQYLHKLDIQCARYLKTQFGFEGRKLKYAAYLYVTYLIEVRADELYPAYQDVLTGQQSKVTVKSIILEEEGHLKEMTSMLEILHPDWQMHASHLQRIEETLFNNWFEEIAKNVLRSEPLRAELA
ncbi:hypothetical protein ACN9ML_10295 [Dyadobacter endophyticus]|uniref:hypothetical protein n=1 Tax=Dyadobacter endophyticus TaxID=1749036 RepID=UPI003CEE225B